MILKIWLVFKFSSQIWDWLTSLSWLKIWARLVRGCTVSYLDDKQLDRFDRPTHRERYFGSPEEACRFIVDELKGTPFNHKGTMLFNYPVSPDQGGGERRAVVYPPLPAQSQLV